MTDEAYIVVNTIADKVNLAILFIYFFVLKKSKEKEEKKTKQEKERM